MTRDADDIRKEIDDTREELGETLEAIGARVAPSHVAQQVRDDVGEKVSPKRILERRTEGLRQGLRAVLDSGAAAGPVGPDGAEVLAGGGPAGGGAPEGTVAQLGDRLRRMSATAAEQARAAPEDEQVRARVLAAFGSGVALTAVLPAFARRRSVALLVGAILAGVAAARLAR